MKLSRLAILVFLPILSSCSILSPFLTPSVEEAAVEGAADLAVEGIEAIEKYEVKKIEDSKK